MIFKRLAAWWRGGSAQPAEPSAGVPPAVTTWARQLELAGVTESQWLDAYRDGGRLYADLPDARVAWLRVHCPERVSQTLAAAERAMRHEFDLLGSGWCRPIDPDRAIRGSAYQPIDWSLDPIARLRFPTGFAVHDWKPQMRPGLADVKWPWEIGRCQHWVTLAQAYRLSGDERFADEIVRQHDDFMAANPVGIGVQYIVAMDIAIRAFNWALAFEMIRASAAFRGARGRLYRSLLETGVFIEAHLENGYEVTSNHFLSNVVGLYGLGFVFADLPAGQQWLRLGRDWLEQEMQVQVLDDGADYESSVPYHRLVLELFLAGARLADRQGSPLSDAYCASLERMADFMATVLRPDGLLPQVGDADDGRLHVFTDYGDWQPQDARHILAPAALMFDRPAWFAAAGETGGWEAAWWGYDVTEATTSTARVERPVARIFEQAGIAVAKSPASYLMITNGRVGTNGFGNHKHNDLLGFEFHAAGVPLFVDPGSYVYTSDPDARNLFRGTAYHNTLRVDGVEQNDIRLDYLFRMFETAVVEHLQFEDRADRVEYRGRHTGYERLPEPVGHERTFVLDKTTGALQITDRLTGTGHHSLAWHFHVAPGVAVEEHRDRSLVLAAGSRRWRLRLDERMMPVVSDVWYSPSYGVRIPCRAIDIALNADVSQSPEFTVRIQPDHV